MKLKEIQNEYFNNSKPLIKQLYKYKKKCFFPSYNIYQLIKFKCQYCTIPGCQFGKAISSNKFKSIYETIIKDKNLKLPDIINTNTTEFERFCANKNTIKQLLDSEQKKFLNENIKSHLCIGCKHKDYCPLTKNLRNLILFDIDEIDKSGNVKWTQSSDKIDMNGVHKSSYYYKNYINNENYKDDIKTFSTEEEREKIYNRVLKIYDKNDETPNNKIKILDIHLLKLIQLYNKNVNFDENFILYNKIKNNKNYIPPQKDIGRLKQFKNINLIDENLELNEIYDISVKTIMINKPLLLIYKKIKKCLIKHIIYELILTKNPFISRNKINELWNITETTQIKWEKQMGINKTENGYITNKKIIDLIFIYDSYKRIDKKNKKIIKKLQNC